jgi:quinol monooxygenase YgiN
MTVVVVASWTTSQESIDEVLALIGELVAQSRAEPGCLGYDVYQVVDEPSTGASEATGNRTVVLIETYCDADAQAAHRDSTHFQELVLGRIVPLLIDRRVELLTPLS